MDLINSAEKIQLKDDPLGKTNTSLMNKHTQSGAGDSQEFCDMSKASNSQLQLSPKTIQNNFSPNKVDETLDEI